jgi:hypothetical protein
MNPVEAAFGTRDKGEILLRMFAVLLRKVALQDGEFSDEEADAIFQALYRLATACDLSNKLTRKQVARIAADASRDARMIEHAVAFISGNTDYAELLLVELFRVSISDRKLSDSELDWLAGFAQASRIPVQRFYFIRTRFGYDTFGFQDTRDALRCLGLDRHAERVDIERRYRELSKQFHPDRHPGLADEAKKVLAARFVEITNAYRLLIEITEAGSWCRARGDRSLVAAGHGLIVDCFFCEAEVRLPPEHGILESARCRSCKSCAVFPRPHAEHLLQICASREPRPVWFEPEPEPIDVAEPSESEIWQSPRESSPAPQPSPTSIAYAALLCVVLLAGFFVAAQRPVGQQRQTRPSSPRPQTQNTRQPPIAKVPRPPTLDGAARPTSYVPPRKLPPPDPIGDLIAAAVKDATALMEKGHLKDGDGVLAKRMPRAEKLEARHFDAWAQGKLLHRAILLAMADQTVNPVSASCLALRRKAAEVCGALMVQYAKQGNTDKASVHFEEAKAGISKALADIRKAVSQGEAPTTMQDFETASLLDFQAKLYVDYGVLMQNEAYVTKGVEGAAQTVSFCESAFGVDSEQAAVAKRNERRLANQSGLGRPAGGKSR